jgi:hypothetical protein
MLDAFAECFRQGDCRRELPSIQGALAALDAAAEEIRESRILASQKLEAPVRMVNLINIYHSTGEALEECALDSNTGDPTVLGRIWQCR